MLGRRQFPPSLVIVLVAVLSGIVLQVLGDARVADAMWRTTGEPFNAASDAGHDLSGLGDLVVVLAGLGFAIGAGVTRQVRPALAVLAGVLVIVPPPFFWPAAGVGFVLLHALTTGRSLPTPSPQR